LFFLGWYRNKKVTGALAALLPFLLVGTVSAFAAPATPQHIVVYKTSLALDLDGDHIPETVTIRQGGSFYQVVIHFSTGRPKLRLRTYVAGDVAGLTLEVADINNDSEADLVITSATSLSPVAAWLNRGTSSFQRVNVHAYSFLGRSSGPRLKQKVSDSRDPVGSLSTERVPQAEIAESLSPHTALQNLISSLTHSSPSDFWLAEVSSRGPPSAPHL